MRIIIETDEGARTALETTSAPKMKEGKSEAESAPPIDGGAPSEALLQALDPDRAQSSRDYQSATGSGSQIRGEDAGGAPSWLIGGEGGGRTVQ